MKKVFLGRRWQVGAGVLLLVFLILYPKFFGLYWSLVLVLAGCYFLGCLGYSILLGLAGQISFGQAAFAAIGAYTCSLLMLHLGTPAWAAVFLGGLLAAVIAYPIGIPALKIKGHYLALVTLAFGEGTVIILRQWISLTRGCYGLQVPLGTFGPWDLKGEPLYYFVLFIVLILAIMAHNIDNSRLGRAFKAIRDREEAASSLGINLLHYKCIAFALSGFYTGIGGALLALSVRLIMPIDFCFTLTIFLLTMVVVGGLRSVIAGSAIGAVLLTIGPEFMTGTILQFKDAIYGLLILICFLFLPGGIVGGLTSVKNKILARAKGD